MALLFFGHRPIFFWNDRNKLSQFGYDVRKDRLVNTVVASFDTLTGEMTEMSQGKKQVDRFIKCMGGSCEGPVVIWTEDLEIDLTLPHIMFAFLARLIYVGHWWSLEIEMRHYSCGAVQCSNTHSFSATMCVTKLRMLKTRRAIVRSGNGVSAVLVTHALERKFDHCSIHTRFTI